MYAHGMVLSIYELPRATRKFTKEVLEMAIPVDQLVRRQWLKDLRAEKKLTVREAAKRIGLSWTHYSDIENGRKKPSFEMAYKISKFYGFKMEKFIS